MQVAEDALERLSNSLLTSSVHSDVEFSSLQTIIVAILLLTPGVPAHLSAQQAAGYDWSKLDLLLTSSIGDERSQTQNLFSGITVVIAAGDQVVYSKGFGDQTIDSVLPIASSTKMPSGLVIMKLVELGLLDLDRPVGEYLKKDLDFVWPPDKAALTTRMLFNHTSGLSVEAPCLNDQRNTTLRACAQEIARQQLEFTPPGSQFAYSGSSMQLAGYVAELVSGRKWNDLFAEYVAKPLTLTRFSYGLTDNPRIAGGAVSNAGDYLRFLQMFLGGGVYQRSGILSPSIWQLMGTNQVAGVPKLPNRNPGRDTLTGYSFGWWHSDTNYLASQPEPRTRGPELSDQGAFGCTPWLDLSLNYAAVLLVNKRTQSGTELWNQMRPLVIEQIRKNHAAASCVRSADYGVGLIAPGSIATVLGSGSPSVPGETAGVSLRVRDASGAEQPAPLLFASPTQINFAVPQNASPGNAMLIATSGGPDMQLCGMALAHGAASLYSADSSGSGWAAAQIIRLRTDGSQTIEPVVRAGSTARSFEPVAIDLGSDGDTVYLSLYGTGFSTKAPGSQTLIRIGSTLVTPSYAGPQEEYPGLDQINVPLPRSLRGSGPVAVAVSIDGFTTNAVRVLFQ